MEQAERGLSSGSEEWRGGNVSNKPTMTHHPPKSTANTPACISDNPEIKRQFAENVSKAFSRQKKPELTRNRIRYIIDQLKEYKDAKEIDMARNDSKPYFVHLYDVGGTPTAPILLLGSKQVACRKVLPSEDYYDVLMQLHLATHHGRRNKLKSALKQKDQFIPRSVLTLFDLMLSNCPYKYKPYLKRWKLSPHKTCRVEGIPEYEYKLRRGRQGIIELIQLDEAPDGVYNWVLYYEDQSTKYCVLRALRTKLEVEVAKELVKIFLDIGFPNKLQCNLGCYYVSCVITELKRLWPTGRIAPGKLSAIHFQDDTVVPDIKTMIHKWASDSTSDCHWATKGIYFIQYKLNRTPYGELEKTPCEELFKRNLTSTQTKPEQTKVDEFDEFLAATGQSNSRVKDATAQSNKNGTPYGELEKTPCTELFNRNLTPSTRTKPEQTKGDEFDEFLAATEQSNSRVNKIRKINKNKHKRQSNITATDSTAPSDKRATDSTAPSDKRLNFPNVDQRCQWSTRSCLDVKIVPRMHTLTCCMCGSFDGIVPVDALFVCHRCRGVDW